MKPRIPIDNGTAAKRTAPSRNALPSFSFFTANALCQKLWSPNGPDIRPIVVGRPKDRNISIPLPEKSVVQSPDIPLSPCKMPCVPVFLTPNITNRLHAISMNTIWIASVSMDALIPENKEYEIAIHASRTVMALKEIPVTALRIWLPARSWTPVDSTDNPISWKR